ncbi:Putative SANT/Myb domain, SWIRM domain, Homeobox-like domain superfamily protein [Septoria linicola]|uniref:SANT/Myb domain, SWIRM domain, Homeobox-like domain superfamily protein n=1 Tax=Septoria linicola TaxID=215465 RepID=A0A9Q9AJ40_9PEZI|nr:Putative SANT/Myb domain, SWIRM domain, Homeobox-like domain superfamily protein [Septoria linicola]
MDFEFANEDSHAPGEASDERIQAENEAIETGAKQESQNQDQDQDTSMVEDTEDAKTEQPATSDKPAAGDAAPVSDNPLDAPDAPAPENADEGGEDEEMGDTKDATPAAGATPAPAQTKAVAEQSARSHLIDQNHAIILPSYSAWFDMHEIHNLERKALPEFFNNRNRSKTPAVYKDYRDFMVNTYRLNPSEYLTVTACRRNLAGDVCAIMRVHSFLEQWGLINYQIDPDTRPSNIGPPFTGHFRITADTPRGLQPLQPAASTITAGKPHAGTERLAAAGKADLNLEVRRNIYDEKGKDVTPAKTEAGEANGEKSVEEGLKQDGKQYFCYSCGRDCTRVRYHNSKNPPAVATTPKPNKDQRYDLCSLCYQEGRFPSSTTSADYTKLENENYRSIGDKEAQWKDSELLLLLEGLEMFDDSWEQVAEHVGSKTREECVLKFLQLEIEDKYLEETPSSGAGAQDLAYLSGGRLPFSQFDNPVMSVMGFLAGLADPATTAKAAGKSVEEMRRQLKQRIEAEAPSAGGAEKDKPSEGSAQPEDLKGEDSMDVDDTTSLATREPPTSHDLPTTALSLTAARSAALASHTERQLTNQVSAAVNLQLQKLELKLQQFSEMEALLQAERREIERSRQQLFIDRLQFRKRVRETEAKFANMKLQQPQPSAEQPQQQNDQREPTQPAEASGSGNVSEAPQQSEPTSIFGQDNGDLGGAGDSTEFENNFEVMDGMEGMEGMDDFLNMDDAEPMPEVSAVTQNDSDVLNTFEPVGEEAEGFMKHDL